MKRNRLLFIAALLLLAVGAWYAFQPSQTPPSQPPLVTLTSVNFANAFYSVLNSDTNAVRLVLLVSPT